MHISADEKVIYSKRYTRCHEELKRLDSWYQIKPNGIKAPIQKNLERDSIWRDIIDVIRGRVDDNPGYTV